MARFISLTDFLAQNNVFNLERESQHAIDGAESSIKGNRKRIAVTNHANNKNPKLDATSTDKAMPQSTTTDVSHTISRAEFAQILECIDEDATIRIDEKGHPYLVVGRYSPEHPRLMIGETVKRFQMEASKAAADEAMQMRQESSLLKQSKDELTAKVKELEDDLSRTKACGDRGAEEEVELMHRIARVMYESP